MFSVLVLIRKWRVTCDNFHLLFFSLLIKLLGDSECVPRVVFISVGVI